MTQGMRSGLGHVHSILIVIFIFNCGLLGLLLIATEAKDALSVAIVTVIQKENDSSSNMTC